MRLSPSRSILPAAFALFLLPAALAAQTTTPNATRPPGCRGTSSSTSAMTLIGVNGQEVQNPDYPIIESVQPGSPAAVAGMKAGDIVAVQDGYDLVGNPPPRPALAGDTVRFVVWRGDQKLTIPVVMGRWDPPQEAPGVTRVCRPVEPPTGRD
jgi:predicted metalloprotease with PDZ domain